MIKKLFILLDYRGSFYSSTREIAGSMNVSIIKSLFEGYGYDTEIEEFSEVDFRSDKYRGAFVLYQSSEDPDLRYKDYIEDILLGLEIKGAILIPDFHKFRAHHNKVFMEILRDTSEFTPIQNIVSDKYGTLSEFKSSLDKGKHRFPIVIKPSFGSRSSGVGLARFKKEALQLSRRIARSYSLINLKRFIEGIFNGKGFKPISNYRKKFIVQNFVSGLSHDYRILVYGSRFYVLRRENRSGDFRASGSGILSFPKQVPKELLDYAEIVLTFFDTPFISLDVAIHDENFFLLEFQFLSFGQYALEHSPFFFRKEMSQWIKIEERSNLEEVFTEAVDVYINRIEI